MNTSFLTPLIIANIALGILCALLLCASWFDFRSHRIPNWLVFSGALLGIALNTILPEGYGFTSFLPGAIGFWQSLAGLGLGLAILLPLYLLRAMSAGDVKLIAMVGAFLGPNGVIGTVLLTFVMGGVLAILVSLRNGVLQQMFNNTRSMLMNSLFKALRSEMPTIEPAAISVGKMPYAIAIATGTFAYFALARYGYMESFQLFAHY